MTAINFYPATFYDNGECAWNAPVFWHYMIFPTLDSSYFPASFSHFAIFYLFPSSSFKSSHAALAIIFLCIDSLDYSVHAMKYFYHAIPITRKLQKSRKMGLRRMRGIREFMIKDSPVPYRFHPLKYPNPSL